MLLGCNPATICSFELTEHEPMVGVDKNQVREPWNRAPRIVRVIAAPTKTTSQIDNEALKLCFGPLSGLGLAGISSRDKLTATIHSRHFTYIHTVYTPSPGLPPH